MRGTARKDRRALKKSGEISITWGEAPGRQLAKAGEETALCGVDVDADGEERVHEMHPSVLFDAYEGDALQTGDHHLPQHEM